MVVAAAVVIVVTGYWAIAADTTPPAREPQRDSMRDGMMDKHGHMGGMCPGHMMMGRMMTSSQLVAMPDGDVVVMMGTRLTKYDKNLAVVKEVEMKLDTDAMMKRMEEMCDRCPACKAMKEREKANAGTENK
jgi:hypothetical protein